MLNLLLWLAMLAGLVALVWFTWRSAMRRRGFRLLRMLESEQVVRFAVDVPMRTGEPEAGSSPGTFGRRGTIVLTRKRLAGFAHRARFVLVRSGKGGSGVVRADGEWVVVRPASTRKGVRAPEFRFQVPDAEGWSEDARKVLRS